ncbi:MAG TPA: NfeD family protein [Vicinamibacterales bacterium]|nr:NfeD family protein [Vicinamibacterales bacterium]
MRRSLRRLAFPIALTAGVPLWIAAASPAPVVETAMVHAIIHPVTAEFMRDAIARADADGDALVVFTLQTPGGLLDSTRDINNAIIHAKTPVAVWIGPSGNRAASAGFLITMAADVAAMAPGTHLGAAHPVSGNGGKMDDVESKKAASDTAAYARTLATQRNRNVALAEQAVLDSRSFTDREARDARPPLVDVVAADIPDLIRQLDGRTIHRFDGSAVTLHLSGAQVREFDMTWAQRVLSAIAHPQIAYLLLTLGTLGLTIELWSPGAIVPGVAGGLCLLLAFFALQVLPVNYAGVLLILLGVVLLVMEVKVTSHGALAVGGIASLFFGSIMLFDSPLPELRVGLELISAITIAISGIILFLVRLAVQSQRRPAITGESGMLHAGGEAITSIEPGGVGRVAAHGEIWTATALEPISAGEAVIVTGIRGLLLTVARSPDGRRGGPDGHREGEAC